MMRNSDSGNGNSPITVAQALIQLLHSPVYYFVTNWNWKSALFGAINRGTIFFIATIKRGTAEMSVAVLVEIVFSATVAGIYAAFTQAMRFAQPGWLAACVVAFVIPAAMLGFDYLAHFYTGMHHIRPAVTFATGLSVVSSLFNLFIMRRGAMVVGEESQPLWRDLMQMPVLIVKFVCAGPLWLISFIPGLGPKRRVQIVPDRNA